MHQMNVGVTGHQRLNDKSWDWCIRQMSTIVDNFHADIVGFTCLAVGADQIFAKILVEKNFTYVAILPFKNIEQTFDGVDDLNSFRALRNLAVDVKILPDEDDVEVSFFNAGKQVVDFSDILIAVWDGKESAGLGGTADVVNYARNANKSVVVIDPYLEKVTGVPNNE